MAITPTQAKEARRKASSFSLAVAESKIDSVLKECSPATDGYIWVNLELSSHEIEVIAETYQRAGWTVQTYSDRDGSGLKFKPRLGWG